MKLKSLRLENFAKFTDFECEFDGKVTHLVGANGSGKTTVGITALWACLKGIAEKGRDGQLIGDRFRFIGGEKSSADVELTLVDEKVGAEILVQNHITKAGNKITFDAPEGYKIGEDWLENLLSVSLMSAKNFSQLSPKTQALALGIDTEKHDTKIQSVKDDYTVINREYRAFGEIPKRAKVEKVSVTDLVKKKDEIDKKNRDNASERETQKENAENLVDAKGLVDELTEQLEEAKKDLEETTAEVGKAVKPPEDIPTDEIIKQIEDAEGINEEAAEWETHDKERMKKAVAKKALEENKAEQAKLVARRLKYIHGALKVPMEGLEVDDSGGLLLHGKPIREPYFSKGELEIAVALIYAATDPELKLRFIDDFELLDEKNQTSIVKDLLAADFQIITSEIHGPDVKKGVVTLRECKRVEQPKPKASEKKSTK